MSLKDTLSHYDIILVGDGSGINKEGSWAVALIDKIQGEARLLSGFCSLTTINVMELMGYIHALNYLEKTDHIHARIAENLKPSVVILTDSSVTANCGNGEHQPKANLAFWKCIEYFKTIFTIVFINIKRSSIPLNKFSDKVAGEMRRASSDKFNQLKSGFDKWLDNDDVTYTIVP